MKTFMAKPAEIKRDWYVIDATGISLGRVATKAANVLRGKHKAIYTPNVDCGDYVIVINADKVKLTGNKLDQKMYYNHSGYTGGLRERTAKELLRECFLIIDLVVKWVKNYLFIEETNINILLNNQKK